MHLGLKKFAFVPKTRELTGAPSKVQLKIGTGAENQRDLGPSATCLPMPYRPSTRSWKSGGSSRTKHVFYMYMMFEVRCDHRKSSMPHGNIYFYLASGVVNCGQLLVAVFARRGLHRWLWASLTALCGAARYPLNSLAGCGGWED
jgi:hypothetical protein